MSHAKLVAIVGLAFLAAGCVSVRFPADVAHQFSAAPSQAGVLREFSVAASEAVAARPAADFRDEPAFGTQAALLAIAHNEEALAWRLALADTAEVSLDIQTFLWELDDAGTLLLERLLQAADRGVRVRILVDDILNGKPDRTIAALATHPNLDIRIFNPNPSRRTGTGSAVRFLMDMETLNRRMHNKLFVADGQVAILGGRNVGDKYFGLHAGYNFLDLDVVVVGDVLPEMTASFDSFWNSPYAVPGEALSRRGTADHLQAIRYRQLRTVEQSQTLGNLAVPPVSWGPFFNQARSHLVPVRVRYVFDHPYEREQRPVVPTLKDLVLSDTSDVIIVTPYFLPGDETFQHLANLRSEGARVRLLVPSLASINHTAVHSHFRKYRPALLAHGIELFEYRHDPGHSGRTLADTPPVGARRISLHLKAVIAGEQTVYVGSLNFDHRAIRINTENGLIIRSQKFADDMRALIEPLMLPEEAWHVTSEDGGIRWSSADDTRRRPPARSGFQRVSEFLYRLLPIEEQL